MGPEAFPPVPVTIFPGYAPIEVGTPCLERSAVVIDSVGLHQSPPPPPAASETSPPFVLETMVLTFVPLLKSAVPYSTKC